MRERDSDGREGGRKRIEYLASFIKYMVGQHLGKILKIIYCELQSTGCCGEPVEWTWLIEVGIPTDE